jgi:hypothetical protein
MYAILRIYIVFVCAVLKKNQKKSKKYVSVFLTIISISI